MMIWLSVGVGGALGAMSRYGLALLIGTHASKFPLATFSANVIGALMIGAFYVLIFEKMIISETLRPLLMVGFLGGLTTFSSFSLESMQLMQSGKFLMAGGYVVSSVVVCLIATWIAIVLTRMI